MHIRLRSRTLVVLCGPVSVGKSLFAAHHFSPTQIVSAAWCRMLLSDQAQDDPDVTPHAFALFHAILRQPQAHGRLSVADSTALKRAARQPLLQMAQEAGFATCLLVFAGVSPQAQARPGPSLSAEVLVRQRAYLRQRTLHEIREEPWDQIFVFEEWPREVRFGRPRRRGLHHRARGALSTSQVPRGEGCGMQNDQAPRSPGGA